MAEERPQVLRLNCRKPADAAGEAGQIGPRAGWADHVDEFEPVEVQQMKLAAGVEHEVGLLEVAMGHAFAVQVADQFRGLADELRRGGFDLGQVGPQIHRPGDGLHQHVAAPEPAEHSTISGGDNAGGGQAGQFEMIRLPIRPPCLGLANQILEEVADLAQLLKVDAQTVRSTHHKALLRLRAHFREDLT